MRAGIAARLREGGHTRVGTAPEKTRVQCFSACNTDRKVWKLSGDESFTVVPMRDSHMSASERDVLHVWVGGDLPSLAAVLSGRDPDDGSTLAAESVDDGAWRDGDRAVGSRVDCLLLPAALVGDGGPVSDADEDVEPDVPVVVLADGEYGRAVRRATTADAAETLPREFVTDDPGVAAERLLSVVRRNDGLDRNGADPGRPGTEPDRPGEGLVQDRTDVEGEYPDEQREKYSTLVEQSSDGIVVVQDGEYVFANGRFAEITGYDRESLLGRPFDEVFTPEYRDLVRERYRQRVDGESPPSHYDVEIETADGEVRTLSLAVSRIDHGGEPATMATFRDVTERKRRERAVRALQAAADRMQGAETAEAVAEIAVEAARDALDLPLAMCWFHDPSGGTEPDEDPLVPVAATNAIHEEGLYSGLSADRYEYDIFREGAVTTYSPRERAPSNPLGSAVLLPLGEHGLVAAGRHREVDYDEVTLDVARALAEHTTTALDRIERAREVRERERRFRLIADRIDQVIFLSAPDFSTVEYVNPAYEDIWGRPVEELLADPQAFADGIDDRDREAFEAEFGAMLTEIDAGDPADSYEFEYRVRRPDGDVRSVRATGYPVADGDDVDRFVGIVEDVTERRELERTYRSVFENVSDGLVVHDPDTGEITDVNDRFCEMNGYERETLVGETIDIVTGPNHEYEHAQEMIEQARDGDSQLFEWRNERADGSTFPVEVHLSVVDVQGDERVLASVRDVTERKRREREYEQIFDGVNDAIAVFDPDTGEITDVNDTYHELLGYDDLETIRELGIEGLSVTEEGYTGERGAAIVREVAETGEPTTVEWRGETRDGDQVWLEATLAPAEIGGEQRVLSMQRDVTERKRREREYEQIFNAVNDVINVYDPETGELLDVNETLSDLTGYDRERIIAEGLDLVSATDEGYDSERAREIIGEVVDSGEPRELEWQLETADGERRWLDVRATPASINGEDRLLTISRDVTERRRSERRLRTILDRIDEAIYLNEASEITHASQSPDYVSSGYEAIWGQPLDGIRDTYEEGFFGTLHPDDEAEYRAFVESVVRDIEDGVAADSYSTEYRIQRPDGDLRWVQSDYYPVEWPDGPPRVAIVSRDVTDRKERERRIASFEEATEDLATADDSEEAAALAVEAATDALELPAVGAYLYDDDAGVLRPEVRSEDVPEGVGSRPVGPGDGPLWEAFATGTVVDPEGAGVERVRTADGGIAGENDGLADWRAVALGNHGVLLVGVVDGTLEPDTLQAAHVLAATLEAGLNHLRGQQRLADQEEALRTQTERADRLDRIARLTQDVEAAITEASDPTEVNRAVCERLAGSGPYAAAWVGGVDVGADRLTTRAVVGTDRGYVDGLDLSTTDDSADPHPAVSAWNDDDVAVADSLVGGGPAGDWRRRALAAGYQSLCAVPLTYDGITHGVLVVAATEPNAFGQREREVLGGLGHSVGYALAAIERRRALETDETVELEFAGEGVDLEFARLAREADCEVRHERTVPREDGAVSVYLALDGDVPDDAPGLADGVLSGTVEPVADGSDATVLEVVTDDWFGSGLAEYGAVLREASATPGETTVGVEVPAGADVRSFADRLAEISPSLDLVAKRQHRRQDRTPEELHDRLEAELTDRQYEVLTTALSAGYFEWPRENDGSDVADRLGITQPTLNKHLRLGERKTFELLFGDR